MHAPSYEIAITVWRRKFRGTYQVDGGELCVSSAYGSDCEPLARVDAEAAARRLLKEIVLKNAR
jgi:hypothetical protein